MALDYTRMKSLVREAYASGSLTRIAVTPSVLPQGAAQLYSVDFAGKCENPPQVVHDGAAPQNLAVSMAYGGRYRTSDQPWLSVAMSVRCRRCPPCLRMRAALWRRAMEMETRSAYARGLRTWFGTLTLSPQSHWEMQLRAERKAGRFLDGLPPEEQFALRHMAVSRELTLAIKRIRKRMKARHALRYCLVAELHKSGLPHYHMLLHEAADGHAIRKSVLNDLWSWGFSQWRLVDPNDIDRSCRYVAKYLSKAAVSRVRASILYGGGGQGGDIAPSFALAPPAAQPASPAKGVGRGQRDAPDEGPSPRPGLTL